MVVIGLGLCVFVWKIGFDERYSSIDSVLFVYFITGRYLRVRIVCWRGFCRYIWFLMVLVFIGFCFFRFRLCRFGIVRFRVGVRFFIW